MKITLTTEEIEHAISCYLKANAAVDIVEFQFSLKRTGIEAEVETTVKEVNSPDEAVQGVKQPDMEPEEVTELIPVTEEAFTPESVEVFEVNPDELIDGDTLKNSAIEEDTQLTFNLDESIEPGMNLNFDAPPSETVEEMPVFNTVSIADILGC